MNDNEKRIYLLNIGERVRAKREALGYTRDDLSSKAELSTDTVKSLESGSTDSKISSIAVICKALGVSADYLLFGEGGELPKDMLFIPNLSMLNDNDLLCLRKMINIFVESRIIPNKKES